MRVSHGTGRTDWHSDPNRTRWPGQRQLRGGCTVLLGLRRREPGRLDGGPTIQHTFPTQAAWRDVKLLVGDNGSWGSFRQEEPIDFFPTYYPALVPPTEPLPPSTGPQADPCGALTPAEQDAMIAAAGNAQPSHADSPSLDSIASYALKER